jgi:aspartyl protease family protein
MMRLPFPGGHMPGSGMGNFRVPIQVGSRGGNRFAPLDALVATGATYTWIPRDVLETAGVTPEEEWPFVLADGREVRYEVAWIAIRIGERVQPTIAVFGEPDTEPLLGAFTLEGFLLAADPVNRRLISVPGLLKGLEGRQEVLEGPLSLSPLVALTP